MILKYYQNTTNRKEWYSYEISNVCSNMSAQQFNQFRKLTVEPVRYGITVSFTEKDLSSLFINFYVSQLFFGKCFVTIKIHHVKLLLEINLKKQTNKTQIIENKTYCGSRFFESHLAEIAQTIKIL